MHRGFVVPMWMANKGMRERGLIHMLDCIVRIDYIYGRNLLGTATSSFFVDGFVVQNIV